jgi:hypothetical protein
MTDVEDVKVVENGAAALEETVAFAKSDMQDLVDGATSEFGLQRLGVEERLGADNIHLVRAAVRAATGLRNHSWPVRSTPVRGRSSCPSGIREPAPRAEERGAPIGVSECVTLPPGRDRDLITSG